MPSPPVTKHCEWCKSEFTTSYKKRSKRFCSIKCIRKITTVAAKVGIQKAIVEGRWQGWISRANKAPSYPEQYFIDLFKAEGIEFEREKKCGRWFIDFAIKNLAIEIDGKQHEFEARKQSDAVKDAFLSASGWKVLRIKWHNPRTEKGKSLLYSQIELLKQELSGIS